MSWGRFEIYIASLDEYQSMSAGPTLEIDSIPVSLAEVWVHQQSDPYPGDHTFELIVPVSCLGDWKHQLAATASHEELAQIALKMVKWSSHYWLQNQSIEPEPARYVLNKVLSVESADNALVLSGICSTFIEH